MKTCLWCRKPYDPASRNIDGQMCYFECQLRDYCSDKCAKLADEEGEAADDAEADEACYMTTNPRHPASPVTEQHGRGVGGDNPTET